MAPKVRPLPLLRLDDPVEAGLLADINEHPDDDVLRLVYADWLEEHTERQRRADYIRAAILHDSYVAGKGETLPGGAGHGDFGGMSLLRHGGRGVTEGCPYCVAETVISGTTHFEKMSWLDLGQRNQSGLGLSWDRGFVQSFGGTTQAWLRLGPRLVQLSPVSEVKLKEPRPTIISVTRGVNEPYRPECFLSISGKCVAEHEARSMPQCFMAHHVEGEDGPIIQDQYGHQALLYDKVDLAVAAISRMALRWAKATALELHRSNTYHLPRTQALGFGK